MRPSALFWCLGLTVPVTTACGSDSVEESILPNGGTALSELHGGSVDTLCDWTRDRFAEATGTGCDLGDSDAAPEYGHLVNFAGSSCGPEPTIRRSCTLSVDDYGACVDALVADACGTDTTERCAELHGCGVADIELGLAPSCSELSKCCEEIDLESKRERCESVAEVDSELACGLELATYVGFCPEANGVSK